MGVAWGPVPWLYAAEIFSNAERDAGMGLAVAVEYGGNVAMVAITPFLIHIGMIPSMLMFAILNLLIAVFCYFYVVETKGVPVELVPALFQGSSMENSANAV